MLASAVVEAVSAAATHTMSKPNLSSIQLRTGLGVAGDAHFGHTVQHLSRVRRDPSQPNLRQVHLIHAELHDQLAVAGFAVQAGLMGENITTRGLDLLGLPTGTELHFDGGAVIEVTGLRNPCRQLDGLQPGLLKAVLAQAADGSLIRLAGVMAVVRVDGTVRPGTRFTARPPAGPGRPLEPV